MSPAVEQQFHAAYDLSGGRGAGSVGPLLVGGGEDRWLALPR